MKYFRCCFICLKFGHRRVECQEPPCQICSNPHRTTLHNFTIKGEGIRTSVKASGAIKSSYTSYPKLSRSFLPVVEVTVDNVYHPTCIALLDTGSEINIISYGCYQQLVLSITLNVVGVGGVVSRIKTLKVEVPIKDTFDEVTFIDVFIFVLY